eukprot:3393325-Rhodomonas_salina.5
MLSGTDFTSLSFSRSDPPEGAFDIPSNQDCEAKVSSSPLPSLRFLVSHKQCGSARAKRKTPPQLLLTTSHLKHTRSKATNTR